MKFKIMLFAGALMFSAAAHAKVQHITDWDGKLPGEGERIQTTCSVLCADYDLTTLICPEGEVLKDCEVEGCTYYHKCVSE